MEQTFALHSINSFFEITLIQVNDTPLPKCCVSLGKFCLQTSIGVFKMQGYVLQLAGKQHTSTCSQSNVCFIPAVIGQRSGSHHLAQVLWGLCMTKGTIQTLECKLINQKQTEPSTPWWIKTEVMPTNILQTNTDVKFMQTIQNCISFPLKILSLLHKAQEFALILVF